MKSSANVIPGVSLPSIGENPAFQQILMQYDNALTRFHCTPGKTEHTAPDRYFAAQSAFNAATQSLEAVIDLHVADRVIQVLEARKQRRRK